MMTTIHLKKTIYFFCLILLTLRLHAAPTQHDQTIDKLYHSLNQIPKQNVTQRLEFISRQFLGKPYFLTALGDGPQSRFDQEPLYRTDAFDCETYVATMVALALANNRDNFKECLRKIRYLNGEISFLKRSHFTSIDLNKNNQQQGFFKDITMDFKDKDNQPVAKTAKAIINKPSWFQHLKPAIIRLKKTNKEEQIKRLNELKKLGSKLAVVESQLAYIPLTVLFDKNGQENSYLFAQIPDGAIIEIVRPNWDLQQQIGTHLNVSHLGFAIRKNGMLYFREASSIKKQVIELPLAEYLWEADKIPSIKGINVQIILPQKPLRDGCRI